MDFHKSIQNKSHYEKLKLFALAQKQPEMFLVRNERNQTLLDISFQEKDEMMIRKLVKVPILINTLHHDLTPLMRLITQREDDKVLKILSYPNAIDYGIMGKYGTTLHLAMTFCAYEIVEKMLQDPRVVENINIKNNVGLTVLDIAVMDNSEIAYKLFKKGAVYGNVIISNTEVGKKLSLMFLLSDYFNLKRSLVSRILNHLE